MASKRKTAAYHRLTIRDPATHQLLVSEVGTVDEIQAHLDAALAPGEAPTPVARSPLASRRSKAGDEVLVQISKPAFR